MSAYLLSVIGTVVLSTLFTAILPEGKTSALIHSVMRMACILAIVAPIIAFFHGGTYSFAQGEKSSEFFVQTGIEADSSFIHYYSEMRIAQTEQALAREISERFGLNTTVALSWRLTEDTVAGRYECKDVEITQIRVKMIKAEDEEVLEKMWKFLTENYCSEVLIE